jgi:hypothetical protein
MNRKTLSVLTVVMVAVFTVSVMAQPPQGGQRRGGRRGKSEGFRGRLMREHIAQCSDCAQIAEQIKEAKKELRELNQKIQDHRWEKSLEKLNEFKEQNPDKADDVDKLIGIRKKIRLNQNKIRKLRDQARSLAQELDIPAGVMRGAFGRQHGPGPSRGFGDKVGEQMGPGQRPGRRGDRRPKREGGRGMEPEYGRAGRKGPARGEGREQWQEKRMERLAQTDPELHKLMTEQKELRKSLKDQVDKLTESMVDHILEQVRENVEEE